MRGFPGGKGAEQPLKKTICKFWLEALIWCIIFVYQHPSWSMGDKP